MTPERFAILITNVQRMRYLQRMKARFNFNSLSNNERAELKRLENKVDKELDEHFKIVGQQRVLLR